jgi:hypothetical protein
MQIRFTFGERGEREKEEKVLELLLCLFSICHAMCVVASFPLLLHSTGCFEGKFSFFDDYRKKEFCMV